MPSKHELAWINLENILQDKLPIAQAWPKFVDAVFALAPQGYAAAMRTLDVTQDQEGFPEMLSQIVKNEPLGESIIAIWMGIAKFWDEENEKDYYMLYLNGADDYNNDDAEWAVEALYDPENKYVIPEILEQIDKLIKQDEENYSFFDWILPIAYCALTLDDIIRTKLNKADFLKYQKSLYVTVGYDDGDFINIAPITK